MSPVPSAYVLAILSAFMGAEFPFRLLRHVGDELPAHLASGKDIDILVRWKDKEHLSRLLKENNFKRVAHPLRKDRFLYGVHPFRFYKSKKADFFIDCHFELACRSLNQGEWIPLDRMIQEAAWNSVGHYPIAGLDISGLPPACEWIHLLTRCVFDKRRFDEGYVARLTQLTAHYSDEDLSAFGRPVFFKFTGPLLSLMRAGRYDNIIREHLCFKDY